MEENTADRQQVSSEEDWREQVGDRVAGLQHRLAAANDPVARALSETVGRLHPGDDMICVGVALVELTERVMGLSALDRELAKRAAVERLRELGVPDPRSLVAAAFRNGDGRDSTGDKGLAGSVLALKDVEPWPEPVDGARWLDRVRALYTEYLVLPPGAVDYLAVFGLVSHVIDAFNVAPYAAVLSPVPECGKTRVLELLELVMRRPWRPAVLTGPVLFRGVETYQPTLLLDEAEVVRGQGEAAENVRALLHAGYRRGAAVERCVGEHFELRRFGVFGLKVFAAIGELPATLLSRCVVIPMRRRARGEPLGRFRPADVVAEGLEIQREARRWALDNLDALRALDVRAPGFLGDRQAEVWEPLCAVAQLVGDGWPERIGEAARALCGDAQAPDQAVEAMLLGDLRALFAERDVERLPTAAILEHLVAMQERPWPEWSHGRPLSPRGLARLLGRFGISPTMWRDGAAGGVRGYARQQFEDAWTRYLAPSATSATSATANSSNDLRVADVADTGGPPAGDAWEAA